MTLTCLVTDIRGFEVGGEVRAWLKTRGATGVQDRREPGEEKTGYRRKNQAA